MYCKNCGKQVPDDSTYCPYCGTTLKAWTPSIPKVDSYSTPVFNNNNNPNVKPINPTPIKGKIELLKERLDKLGPQKAQKLISLSKFFKATSIVYFISIFIFFFSTPVLSAVDRKSTFLFGFQIFMCCWCAILVILSISDTIVASINEPLFKLKIKNLIIARCIYVALLITMIVLLSLKMTMFASSQEDPKIHIPTLILDGFAFAVSGVNFAMTSPFIVITPKVLDQIKNLKPKDIVK